jgi:AcrR family transcriptional regulator
MSGLWFGKMVRRCSAIVRRKDHGVRKTGAATGGPVGPPTRDLRGRSPPDLPGRGAAVVDTRGGTGSAHERRGLYHYFPTKRDLVLHGLSEDARARLCQEYRSRLGDLSGWSAGRHVEAYLDLSIRMFSFARPSVQAALELGAEELQAVLDSGMRTNVGELVETLRLVDAGVPEEDLEALARALRRVMLGALVDRHADLGETREQMRVLIEGHAIGARREEFAGSRAV